MDDNIMYFQDENGGQIALQMVDAFEYEAVKYAVFATPENQLEPNQQPDLYVMKVLILKCPARKKCPRLLPI